MRQALDQPLGVYTRQIISFCEAWTGVCPVVAESDLMREISDTLRDMSETSNSLSPSHLTSALKLTAILLINAFPAQDVPEKTRVTYRNLMTVLMPIVESLDTLSSVQAVALVSLFACMSGHVSLMSRLNGRLVQTAQTLGLHRHSRRFKFGQGQIEMRKRLWWWIYGFDK